MQHRAVGLWLVVAVVLGSVLSSDADDKRAKSSVGKGFWKVLVTPNAKWVLTETVGEADRRDKVIVETYDVRKVAGADVARLRWMLHAPGEKPEDIGNSSGRFTQVAVTKAGLYLLDDGMDDAAITLALKKKPSRSDPPKPYEGTKRNQGRYLLIRNEAVCVGEGPLPGDGDCADTCFGEMCIGSPEGIVSLSGTWAPGYSEFEQTP